MFGRKKDEDTKQPGESAPNPLPLKSKPRTSQGAIPPRPSAALTRPEVVRPAFESPRGRGSRQGNGDRSYGDGKTLTVGREIMLSGEINACEKLVVEGRVEASLVDCREIEIADTGTFKGEASIEVAEISGRFDGTITARDLLLVRASGRVHGTIRYGRIEVERGGEVVGDVQTLPSGVDAPAEPAQSSPAPQPNTAVTEG